MRFIPNWLSRAMKNRLRERGWIAPDEINASHQSWTMSAGLNRLKSIGIEPRTVVDLGAAEGRWTEMAMEIFEDAQFLLCEPLPARSERLRQCVAASDRLHFEPVIVGNSQKPLLFDVSSDLDGSGVYDGKSEKALELPQDTLDNLLTRNGLQPPYLIKFDTHGFECPILDGAAKTLAMTDAIIMECYVHRISPTAKLFWEMCHQLNDLGFRVIHISDLMARQYDSTLWQMDLFFVRSDHPVFNHDRYI